MSIQWHTMVDPLYNDNLLLVLKTLSNAVMMPVKLDLRNTEKKICYEHISNITFEVCIF